MKISLSWLKKYIDVNLSPDELYKGLINIGFDIESVENQSEKLKNLVIGKILEKKRHPNADKLTVCTVDIGTEVLSIVCGASNVDAGQKVCVAKAGAIIPNSGIEIKKTKIRGEISEGMICSAKEMNFGDDSEGIMVLRDDLEVGKPFSGYLEQNDVIFEIGITPNRGDLLSHFGVAREIGFLINKKLNIPELEITESNEDIKNYVNVEIENPEACYRYCGRFIKNVSVKESPEWLKKCLTAVGLRPINNVVDITNFVMLECGQPLHAFDYNVIEGKKIIVKNSGKLKTFTTLDGRERVLNEEILLICDARKPIGIAGIMGGENSEIKTETKNVFIESAYFDPVSIRKSAKFLGLQTDSSYRFERGVDIEKVMWACNRAADLIARDGDGEILKGLIDNYPNKIENKKIALRVEYLNKIIGIDFEPEQIKKLLGKIAIDFLEKKVDKLYFEIPSFRREDIQREIDLVEEVARLHGYEKIPDAEYDNIYFDTKEYADLKVDFVNDIRKHFIGRGFKEIITNTLVNEKYVKIFDRNYFTLLNPSNVEMNVLRTNLFVGALETLRNNFNFKANSLKLFEVGDVINYSESERTYVKGIDERNCLNLIMAGEYDYDTLNQETRYFDLFDLKGEVQVLLEKLNIDNFKLNYYNYEENFENRIEFSVQEKILANMFRFSDKALRFFDIDVPVVGCEFYLNDLLKFSRRKKIYKEISKYPPVLRDLSVVVDKGVLVSDVEEVIKTAADSLLKNIKLYDIYNLDKDRGLNKLSYTFTLEYSSEDKTLTDEEVNKVQVKIISSLKKNLKAELRK